jgi:hypothetical protein
MELKVKFFCSVRWACTHTTDGARSAGQDAIACDACGTVGQTDSNPSLPTPTGTENG